MAENKMYKLRKFGPITKRRDYSKTVNNLPVSDLLSIQKESYQWFLSKGLIEVFQNIYPITSNNGRITLEFVGKSLRIDKPKNEYEAVLLAKQKSSTYAFKILGTVRRIDEETGEVKEQEVIFGEIPLMTSGGSFIINGAEKVIIPQLLRSQGAYYYLNTRFGKISNNDLFNRMELIPKLGSRLEIYYKTTSTNIDQVKLAIDKIKNRSINLSVFLMALGFSKETILELFGDSEIIRESLKKIEKITKEDAIISIHNILKKGERISNESKRNLFANIFFNPKRYVLARTGRYTLNRKLNLVERLKGTILAEDLKTKDGKVIYKKGTEVDHDLAIEIQKSFEDKVLPTKLIPEISKEIYGYLIDEDDNKKKNSFKPELKAIFVNVYKTKEDYKNKNNKITVIANNPSVKANNLVIPDIIAVISYFFNLSVYGLGQVDDPDSLVNKRAVNVGELLQNQFQIGLTKMERNAKERMSSKEPEKITPKNVTNNKAIYNQFKTFFNSSQLSQFMDQMNPLSEIANKRRITSLGPGGLSRETGTFEVRDVHSTHYGRICPIETPEGPNIGLILNFANYSKVNDLGFIETPYYPVIKGVVQKQPVYLNAVKERGKTFAQSTIKLDENNKIVQKNIAVRKDGNYLIVSPKDVDYINVSPKQMTSVASSAIPFLENDDANRALMGANMQRQAVPLLRPEAPLIATGIEADVAKYAASNLRADNDGEVTYVDSDIIKIKHGSKNKIYYLRTFQRSNQGSVITQRPLVKVGQKVKKGDIITDGPSFDKGELAIGKNVVVAFTTWNGYNYEDAIIISEKLVKDDVYTSIHIEEQTIQFRKAKIGNDQLTNDIPNTSTFSKRNLDENGIVKVGSEVMAGDVLVGRVSPKGEENPTPEEKLIAAIFVQRPSNLKDTSLKVKHGHGGTIIDVQVLSRENGDKLKDDVEKIVRVFIAQKRKVKVGDKMAGRHGNKGIISRILPVEDMPHLEDGTPVDIMLNPQGVPSRMNIGQVLELHLGMAAKYLNVKFASPVFDGISYQSINDTLKEANLPENGKFDLYDPITGTKFDNKVSIGVMYMIKLSHMVDDKMHARSVGPYSLITQQPLGGKSQNGGQRFGEMETWALESYGATNVLQELLTYKSDNIDGRNRLYNALATGAPLPKPGMPESFNVLAYELRGLVLKLGLELNNDNEEGDK